MIKPFSILDTRSKEWQERKRWWINTYNIQSELGRGDTQSRARFWEDNTVSIFDATLCEKMYEWFCPKEGRVLDPFAGRGSTLVASLKLNRNFIGIELNKEYFDISIERTNNIKNNITHNTETEQNFEKFFV